MGSKMSERVAVVATIDPDANATGTFGSDWVDMTMFDQAMCVVMAGTLGTTAGIDVQIEEATDSSGTGAQNITGKTITELTDANTDSDKQAIINISSDDLDIADNYTHIRAVMTVATATSDSALIILASRPRYGPANDNDLSTVAEIV